MLPAGRGEAGFGDEVGGGEGGDDDGVVVGAGVTLGLLFVGDDVGGGLGGGENWSFGFGVDDGTRGGAGLLDGGSRFGRRRWCGTWWECGFDGGASGGGRARRSCIGRRGWFGSDWEFGGGWRGWLGSGRWSFGDRLWGRSRRGRWGCGNVVVVLVVGMIVVVGVLAVGHFAEEFCEIVFVLAHDDPDDGSRSEPYDKKHGRDGRGTQRR